MLSEVLNVECLQDERQSVESCNLSWKVGTVNQCGRVAVIVEHELNKLVFSLVNSTACYRRPTQKAVLQHKCKSCLYIH